MDLAYSAEYEVFRAEVRDFLSKHSDKAPCGFGIARPSDNALAWQELLIAHGYAARTIPKEYGGYGAEPDILKSRIIAEEFSAARVPMGLAGQGISMLVPTLLELVTEEQKKGLYRADAQGRNHLVPRLFRTRLGLRPGLLADQGSRRRR